ncbi:DinB family protein [Crocinitomix catalasitica]|uniref:DinB family protein n=1 Tax=Crocinitomix catalasitica TaxID=184607 RepID=UPI000483CD26|nr:DinB family protein [Crocinitomix catalasitica]
MNTTQLNSVITKGELLDHWQGHRRLTRRLIEAFPEKEFFNYSIGGMRTAAEMMMELIAITGPGIVEIATGKTNQLVESFEHGNKKQVFLDKWDEQTEIVNRNWDKITEERFHEKIKSFGEYEGTVHSTIFYFIDNEIHHRGQCYVYLRGLGIEPPFFPQR